MPRRLSDGPHVAVVGPSGLPTRPLTARTYAGQMPLLGTKLRVPAARRQLVSRQRLVDRLQMDPTRMPRLVLVSAGR
jgi:hypothetical protein